MIIILPNGPAWWSICLFWLSDDGPRFAYQTSGNFPSRGLIAVINMEMILILRRDSDSEEILSFDIQKPVLKTHFGRS